MKYSLTARSLIVASALVLSTGCKGAAPKGAASPTKKTAKPASSCAVVGSHVVAFGDLLDDTTGAVKGRTATYAGLLELLLSFEHASADLEAHLASIQVDDAALRDGLTRTRGALDKAVVFARTETAAIEKHAHEIAPVAKETQEAWAALRGACSDGREPRTPKRPLKKGAADCSGVREILARESAAESLEQTNKTVDELAALRLTGPLATARDRAVSASRAAQVAIKTRTEAAAPLPKRWAEVQKNIGDAMEGLAAKCKGTMLDGASGFVAAPKPDPRQLTVLVKVKPPSGVEKSLAELAKQSKDEDEKALYEGRAKGAFGSGFLVVRTKADGAKDTLVITNRHVVELGDKAALELADGTSLGGAEIVFTDPTHDVAILRPTAKLAVDGGFAFANTPAKDQQVVIATGFPGMAGRPSYQTTRGYVSNESFRLDEDARPLTFVQHTAPIDPGSSGGPLTDERGHVLGVNTLKVTNRDAVALAVPSSSVLETIRKADNVEAGRSSAAHRKQAARLACLAFVGEIATAKPRMLVLEPMISNALTGAEGMEDAAALGGDETFERVWQADSVRAMRIATLMRVRSSLIAGGGMSVLETCDQAEPDDGKGDLHRYRVRLANFETRQMSFRWEQGHWKVASVDVTPPPSHATSAEQAPKAKPSKPAPPPSKPPQKKKAPAPGARK